MIFLNEQVSLKFVHIIHVEIMSLRCQPIGKFTQVLHDLKLTLTTRII